MALIFFLQLELFRELQLLTSDYLRQRALYALQDLVTRFLTEDSVGAEGGPLQQAVRILSLISRVCFVRRRFICYSICGRYVFELSFPRARSFTHDFTSLFLVSRTAYFCLVTSLSIRVSFYSDFRNG